MGTIRWRRVSGLYLVPFMKVIQTKSSERVEQLKNKQKKLEYQVV